MGTISAKDSHELIRMGIAFVRDRSQSRVREAAQWWTAATDDERPAVRREFEEGVRNYAVTMHRYDEAMREFDDWCRFYTLPPLEATDAPLTA